MPSGKQILLSVLQEYSQRRQEEPEMHEVTNVLQAALCAHCSTSGETMKKISQIGWLSHSDEDGLVKQGIGVKKSNAFLSDIFEELIQNDEIPKGIKDRFPTLSQEEYSLSLDMIWWLLSSLQYWEELSSVENFGSIDKEEKDKSINAYKRWMENYEKDPW